MCAVLFLHILLLLFFTPSYAPLTHPFVFSFSLCLKKGQPPTTWYLSDWTSKTKASGIKMLLLGTLLVITLKFGFFFFSNYHLLTIQYSTIVQDADSEAIVFAKRTVKDLKLPHQFILQIAQSIQVGLSLSFSLFNFLLNRFQLYSVLISGYFMAIRISSLSLDHMKDKTCTLLRKLCPSRFLVVLVCSSLFLNS